MAKEAEEAAEKGGRFGALEMIVKFNSLGRRLGNQGIWKTEEARTDNGRHAVRGTEEIAFLVRSSDRVMAWPVL